ncbi:MAG: ABC transporter ATP-binding protein/permease [Clostridiales bacterium]|jgi:ABC-type multidrug transport system fused ATPase/permease subunit|nr:ABC transporter ATP-binding protein/permease [Clostridiales bacterium]
MGMQDAIAGKYGDAITLWVSIFNRRNNLRAAQRGTQTIYAVIVFICIPMLGAYYMVQGSMGVGTVLMSMQAAGILSAPIMNIMYSMRDINEFKVSGARIAELIAETPERQGGASFSIEGGAPLVELEHVSFAYGTDEALRVISIKVMPGQRIALVGASGSGKSTALRLMAGLYEASAGSVRFAGHDINVWDLTAMRSHMAYVQQDTFLFPGSLRENIECGEAINNLDEVIKCAQLDDWLARQPQGLETDVGERGNKLSGGLRQRVSIARAMARKPLLYLFDEPTSALETAMEADITAAMKQASEGAASVTVAHRLSSIEDSDIIYAMQEGRVVESGGHEQLMNSRGYYYELYTKHDMEAERIG